MRRELKKELRHPAVGGRCFYATDYHIRHLSSPESFSCESDLYNVFANFLCAVYFLWLVIFKFALDCLGEIFGDREMDGVQAIVTRDHVKQVHASCMAVDSENGCLIGYHCNYQRSLWIYLSRRHHYKHCLVDLPITYSTFLCQGLPCGATLNYTGSLWWILSVPGFQFCAIVRSWIELLKLKNYTHPPKGTTASAQI